MVKAIQDYVTPDLSAATNAALLHNEKIARGETGAAAGVFQLPDMGPIG
jgi:hypothetical protein